MGQEPDGTKCPGNRGPGNGNEDSSIILLISILQTSAPAARTAGNAGLLWLQLRGRRPGSGRAQGQSIRRPVGNPRYHPLPSNNPTPPVAMLKPSAAGANSGERGVERWLSGAEAK